MTSRYRIINRPVSYSLEEYNLVFDILFNCLKKHKQVKAIYTFGKVNKPGISDIDILVVFKAGEYFNINLFDLLNQRSNKLFTHGIMAINEEHWDQNKKYTFWNNSVLNYGDPMPEIELPLDSNSIQLLKTQTALEFLVSNYIDLKIQKTYGVIKLRDLLQHTKGLQYDLEYLNIEDSYLTKYINESKDWINNWFDIIPSDKEISRWFNEFEKVYEDSLTLIFKKNKLYLPKKESYNYSKNNILSNTHTISFKRKGFLIPKYTSSLLDKNYIKIQNNLNKFIFNIPFSTENIPSIINERFDFLSKMKNYNTQHYPNFSSLISGLISKIV